MAYNISEDLRSTGNVSDLSNWASNYKEGHITTNHDMSMANLANPDDCIIVAGPPRLRNNDAGDFPVVGVVNGIQYTESSQIAPMKAIGSRRHIFSKSNLPVQGSISHLVLFGKNMFRALYQAININNEMTQHPNTKLLGKREEPDSLWLHNLEEDLFRIPFGLGIIFSLPKLMASTTYGEQYLGGEYIECCVLQSKTTSIQTGQTMVMEQVQFMADRVIPWNAFGSVPGVGTPVAA